MPEPIPNHKFIDDLSKFKKDAVRITKIAKALAFLESNPRHPGLRIERIVNDPAAWSARIDQRCRLSFEPTAYLESGAPDWTRPLILLRILDHDDLYQSPH
jgi:hypothetical protein